MVCCPMACLQRLSLSTAEAPCLVAVEPELLSLEEATEPTARKMKKNEDK